MKSLIRRKLSITNELSSEVLQEVIQLNYLSWPDHGAPEQTDYQIIQKLVEHIQMYHNPKALCTTTAPMSALQNGGAVGGDCASPNTLLSEGATTPNLDTIKAQDNSTSSLNQRSKVVIHCSAGIGRTGTIISIYNIIQSLKILLEMNQMSQT